jgi:hypothetical protein
MNTRPSDSNEIFKVGAASLASCMYRCATDASCLATVYPDPGSVCVGYNDAGNNGALLAGGTQAWRVKGNNTSPPPIDRSRRVNGYG